ncbi:MAG: hypothetical protein DDT22_00771 [candidate division WS2 bacterium]|nr:hypothetical protein [Candidatus Lithacetigena glycinireducens]
MINQESWLKWRFKVLIIFIPVFFIALGIINFIIGLIMSMV